jgi:hypothetical protein
MIRLVVQPTGAEATRNAAEAARNAADAQASADKAIENAIRAAEAATDAARRQRARREGSGSTAAAPGP